MEIGSWKNNLVMQVARHSVKLLEHWKVEPVNWTLDGELRSLPDSSRVCFFFYWLYWTRKTEKKWLVHKYKWKGIESLEIQFRRVENVSCVVALKESEKWNLGKNFKPNGPLNLFRWIKWFTKKISWRMRVFSIQKFYSQGSSFKLRDLLTVAVKQRQSMLENPVWERSLNCFLALATAGKKIGWKSIKFWGVFFQISHTLNKF